MLNILKRQAELKMGIITKDEFMELTTFRFSDFLIAKNNVALGLFRIEPSAT